MLARGAPPQPTATNARTTSALLRTANLSQALRQPFNGGANGAQFRIDDNCQGNGAALADYRADFRNAHDAPAPSFAARIGSMDETIFSVSLSGCGVAASAWAIVAAYCACRTLL